MGHESLNSGSSEPNNGLGLTKEQIDWSLVMYGQHPYDEATGTGMIGVGRSTLNENGITIFVAPGTDTSDDESFPKVFGAETVVYEAVSLPKPQ